MKKAILYTFLITILTLTSLATLQAQPHPGQQNGGGGVGGTRIGEGAPVGNGSFILFTLALAYAGRKYYGLHTAEEEE
jgi:hypothetical protein